MKKIFLIFLFIINASAYSQEIIYEVYPTSINSKYAELGITFLNDSEVIFASSKKNENDQSFTKERRKTNKQLFLELYVGLISPNGDIIETGRFSNETNNKFFESDIAFTPDGKTVFFTWNNFFNTEKRIDSAKWKTLKIMKASINENYQISNITPLPFNSDVYSVRNPTVSKDGKQLYFVSDMEGGFGATDIYVADIYSNGTFGKPKNLGPLVNTKKAEIFPFVDENNTLYFASLGHNGHGNLDIFKADFYDGVFQKPINLPAPINSAFDDFGFVLNESNQGGFFTSNREDSLGDVDIFGFFIRPKVCKQSYSISVLDEITKEKLDNVIISIVEEGVVISKEFIQKYSDFNFEALCDKTYKIVIEKDRFYSKEIEISTNNSTDTNVTKIISLAPIPCIQTIQGYVFREKTNEKLELVTLNLYTNNVLTSTQITQLNTPFSFEINCGNTYKIVAEKNEYITNSIEINATKLGGFVNNIDILLTPEKCSQHIAGIILDEENLLPLPTASVKVYSKNEFVQELKLSANATFKFEGLCTTEYQILTTLNDYINNVIFITTSKNADETIFKEILMESSLELETIENFNTIKTKAINFDLDSDEITEDSAIELNKVVAILIKYPLMKIEIKSHTDSRAPDDYNLQLSHKRAIAIMNYIIGQGINPTRLIAKGYGESQLLNKCANDVKCTEAEHQQNRRTEFIIIEE